MIESTAYVVLVVTPDNFKVFNPLTRDEFNNWVLLPIIVGFFIIPTLAKSFPKIISGIIF
jgi:hypothetical protein